MRVGFKPIRGTIHLQFTAQIVDLGIEVGDLDVSSIFLWGISYEMLAICFGGGSYQKLRVPRRNV